jgi:integrase
MENKEERNHGRRRRRSGKARRESRFPGVQTLNAGCYRIRGYLTDPRTGRQHEIDRRVNARTAEEAARLRLELLETERARLTDTGSASRQRKRLGDLAREWLAKKIDAVRSDGTKRLCPTTCERYRIAVVEHIVPYLGEYYLDALRPADVEEWRDHLAARYRAATVNGIHRILRTMLAQTEVAAARAVPSLAEDDTRTTADEPNALDEDELVRFVEVAREQWPEHYAVILVLFTTAMRISTLRALVWEDFEPVTGLIHVRRRLSGKEVIAGVKRSRTSKDLVPLLPVVWQALQEHRARLNERQIASGLVFPSETGGHRSRSFLNDAFREICAAAGIKKRFTVHGVRRTGARLYREVADTSVAKAIAGHVTDEMHQHYAPASARELRKAGERAAEMLKLNETGDRTGDPKSTTPHPRRK